MLNQVYKGIDWHLHSPGNLEPLIPYDLAADSLGGGAVTFVMLSWMLLKEEDTHTD